MPASVLIVAGFICRRSFNIPFQEIPMLRKCGRRVLITAVAGRSMPEKKRCIVSGRELPAAWLEVRVISPFHSRSPSLAPGRQTLLDFVAQFHANLVEDAWITVKRIDVLNNAIDLPGHRIAARRAFEEQHIFVIFQAFANEFQTNTFDRYVLFTAYSRGTSGIKERSVSVPTIQVHARPRIRGLAICFVSGEI